MPDSTKNKFGTADNVLKSGDTMSGPLIVSGTYVNICSGGVASSDGGSQFPPGNAFDGNPSTAWYADSVSPRAVVYQLPVAKAAVRYSVISGRMWGQNTMSWMFQGSNNGSDWSTLDTRDEEFSTNLETKTHDIVSPTYLYYRLMVTAVYNNNRPAVCELVVYESPTVNLGTDGSVTASSFIGDGSLLTNLPPSGMSWTKFTKTHSDIAVAALSNNIELFQLPAGGVIHAVKMKHSERFDNFHNTAGFSKSAILSATVVNADLTMSVDGGDPQTHTVNASSRAEIESSISAQFTGSGSAPVTCTSELQVTPVKYSGAGGTVGKVAFDGTNCWVINNADGSVTIVAPNGSITNLPGVHNSSTGIASDGTNAWLCDIGAAKIVKVSPAGVATQYTAGDSPQAIAFDGTNMWITDPTMANKVGKMTPAGVYTSYPGITGSPQAIAFDGTNMWVICQGSTVAKVESDGTVTEFSGLSDGCQVVAYDGSSYMWSAASNGRGVDRISSDGSIVHYPFPAGFTRTPTGIASDGTNMWIVFDEEGSIMKVSPSGAMTLYPVSLSNSRGMVSDGMNVWVTEGSDDSVVKVYTSEQVYVISSPITGASSSVVVDVTSPAAITLKLGTDNGGIESVGGTDVSDFTSYKLSLGVATDLTRYLGGGNILSTSYLNAKSTPAVKNGVTYKGTKQSYVFEPFIEDQSSPTSIRLYAVSAGSTLDQATTGSVDVWVMYSVAV